MYSVCVCSCVWKYVCVCVESDLVGILLIRNMDFMFLGVRCMTQFVLISRNNSIFITCMQFAQFSITRCGCVRSLFIRWINYRCVFPFVGSLVLVAPTPDIVRSVTGSFDTLLNDFGRHRF